MPPSTSTATFTKPKLFFGSYANDDRLIAFLKSTSEKHPWEKEAVYKIFQSTSAQAQAYQLNWLEKLFIETPRDSNQRQVVTKKLQEYQIDLRKLIRDCDNPGLQALARIALAINASKKEKQRLIATLPMLLVLNQEFFEKIMLAASFCLSTLSQELLDRYRQLFKAENPKIAESAITSFSTLLPFLAADFDFEALLKELRELVEKRRNNLGLMAFGMLPENEKNKMPSAISVTTPYSSTILYSSNCAAKSMLPLIAARANKPEDVIALISETDHYDPNTLIKCLQQNPQPQTVEKYLAYYFEHADDNWKKLQLVRKLPEIIPYLKIPAQVLSCLNWLKEHEALQPDPRSSYAYYYDLRVAIAEALPAMAARLTLDTSDDFLDFTQRLSDNTSNTDTLAVERVTKAALAALPAIATAQPQKARTCLDTLDFPGLTKPAGYSHYCGAEHARESALAVIPLLSTTDLINYFNSLSKKFFLDEATSLMTEQLDRLLLVAKIIPPELSLKFFLQLANSSDIYPHYERKKSLACTLESIVKQLSPDENSIISFATTSVEVITTLASSVGNIKTTIRSCIATLLTHQAANKIPGATAARYHQLLTSIDDEDKIMSRAVTCAQFASTCAAKKVPSAEEIKEITQMFHELIKASKKIVGSSYRAKIAIINKVLSRLFFLLHKNTGLTSQEAQQTLLILSKNDAFSLNQEMLKILITSLSRDELIKSLTLLTNYAKKEKHVSGKNAVEVIAIIAGTLHSADDKLRCLRGLSNAAKNREVSEAALKKLPVVTAQLEATAVPTVLKLFKQFIKARNLDQKKAAAELITAIAKHLDSATVKQHKILPILLENLSQDSSQMQQHEQANKAIKEALMALAAAPSVGEEVVMAALGENKLIAVAQCFVKEILLQEEQKAQEEEQAYSKIQEQLKLKENGFTTLTAPKEQFLSKLKEKGLISKEGEISEKLNKNDYERALLELNLSEEKAKEFRDIFPYEMFGITTTSAASDNPPRDTHTALANMITLAGTMPPAEVITANNKETSQAPAVASTSTAAALN